VNPAPIVTSSPGLGRIPPGHGSPGVVELQAPDPIVVIGADNATLTLAAIKKTAKHNVLLSLLENKVINVFKLPILVYVRPFGT